MLLSQMFPPKFVQITDMDFDALAGGGSASESLLEPVEVLRRSPQPTLKLS